MGTFKASHTVEVALLFPLILVLIITLVDGFIVYHNRAFATGDLALISECVQEHMAQSTDDFTVMMTSDFTVSNVDSVIKVQRGFLDSFHIGLDTVQLAEKIVKSLKNKASKEAYCFTNIKCHLNRTPLNSFLVVDYEIEIISPFKGMTDPLLASYRKLKGRTIISLESEIQRMTTAKIIADRIEKIDEVKMLLMSIREVIAQWLKIF